MTGPGPAVIAFAGRRIDAPDAPQPRFPAASEVAVASRLRELFERTAATTLVASAACGADIVALEVAGALGMRRRIVLPFDRVKFRRTSVTDRPGDWGARYDAILDAIAPGDLVVLLLAEGDGAYRRANDAILDLAIETAGSPAAVLAVIAWNGTARGDDDITAEFASRARGRGVPLGEIDTLASGSRT